MKTDRVLCRRAGPCTRVPIVLAVVLALVFGVAVLNPVLAQATTCPKVTATFRPTTIDLGKTALLSGTVNNPRAPHKNLTVQRYYSNAWHNLGSVGTNANSYYSLDIKPTTVGSYKYRVVYGHCASNTAVLLVYRWHYLSDLTEAGMNTDFGRGAFSINGHLYPHSISIAPWDPADWAEWNLSRKCTALSAVAGPTDDSSSDAQFTFEVLLDGVQAYSQTIGFGESHSISISTTNVLRVHLDAILIAGSGGAGFGDAKVRCLW